MSSEKTKLQNTVVIDDVQFQLTRINDMRFKITRPLDKCPVRRRIKQVCPKKHPSFQEGLEDSPAENFASRHEAQRSAAMDPSLNDESHIPSEETHLIDDAKQLPSKKRPLITREIHLRPTTHPIESKPQQSHDESLPFQRSALHPLIKLQSLEKKYVSGVNPGLIPGKWRTSASTKLIYTLCRPPRSPHLRRQQFEVFPTPSVLPGRPRLCSHTGPRHHFRAPMLMNNNPPWIPP